MLRRDIYIGELEETQGHLELSHIVLNEKVEELKELNSQLQQAGDIEQATYGSIEEINSVLDRQIIKLRATIEENEND